MQPSGANFSLGVRAAAGSTQAISPPQEPLALTTQANRASVFTPELTAGVADSTARLTSEAPENLASAETASQKLYVADFAERSSQQSYKYVGEVGKGDTLLSPEGASTDLSHVAFQAGGETNASEWVNGTVIPVGVANDGEVLSAAVGTEEGFSGSAGTDDAWHAVSADGSRVYFTSPGAESDEQPEVHSILPLGQLYLRVNAEQPQSPLASTEANGTGTLTEGLDTVSSLVTASGILSTPTASYKYPAGATEFDVETITLGGFVVGQEIVPGSGFEPGTTITSLSLVILDTFPGGTVTGSKLTVSKPSIAPMAQNAEISSRGPAPFAVGQRVSGNGIAPGTTIAAVAAGGSLTLSQPAAASGGPVALRAGGECTVPSDACTVEVSASQRFKHENPQGIRTARYWGASADGSRSSSPATRS